MTDWTIVLPHLGRFSLFLLLLSHASANATAVYKTPLDELSFARSSLAELERTKTSVFEETWFNVETEQKETGWISQTEVVDIWNFVDRAIAVKNTPLWGAPNLLAKAKKELLNGENVKILKSEFNFFEVAGAHYKGWVLRSDLKPNFSNYYFLARKDFKDDKVWKRLGQRILPHHLGPKRSADVLTPFDFDVLVRFENSQKKLAPERHGRWIADLNEKFWTLDKIQILETKNEILFTAPVKQKICLRSEPSRLNHECTLFFSTPTKLKVISKEQVRWVRSQTLELGVTYWTPSTEPPEETEMNDSKEVVNSKHVIFRGDLKSTDGGKSFHPYLRWDKIISLFIKQTREEPQALEINKIEITKNDELKLSLKSRSGKQVELSSKDDGMHWRPSKSTLNTHNTNE